MRNADLNKLWTGKISIESFQSFILSFEDPIYINQCPDEVFVEQATKVLTQHQLKPEQISMHLLFGVVLFNRRYFWEAHEVLEDIWMDSVGEVKTFYQGIIQVSAAMYHVLNQNKAGYKRLSELGRQKLLNTRSPYLGVDYTEALKALSKLDKNLNNNDPFDFKLIPKLKFVDIIL